MINLDQIEHILKAGDRYGHVTPGVVLELIAEVRAWRNEAVAHQAFVDAFNETGRESQEEIQAHGRWESALAAALPYKQAAIDAARKDQP